MRAYQSIDEVALELGDGGPFCPDKTFETIEDIVDTLIEAGNTDKVFAYHDDHLSLKENLSTDFLESSLHDIEKPEFEAQIERVLEEANIIIHLSKRDLSDEDMEEIEEDKLSRGGNPDN